MFFVFKIKMEYSLGLTNQLTNYIRQSSSRRQVLYLLKTTNDLERYFSKMKTDYEQKINELQHRLDQCLNYEQLVERFAECHQSRNKREGLSLNLERYEDLLQCNFKQIQWVRSSRMDQDAEGEQIKNKKIEAIQAEVNRLEQFILQRETEQQKNLKDLQQSVEQQFRQIKQNFQEKCLKQKSILEQQCTEISLLQQSFSQNLLELEQSLNRWNTTSLNLINTKLQTVQSQLIQLQSRK